LAIRVNFAKVANPKINNLRRIKVERDNKFLADYDFNAEIVMVSSAENHLPTLTGRRHGAARSLSDSH
jgi:hypothetical protein